MSRLRSLLPPPGPLRGYSVMSAIDGVGTGVFATGSAVFFTAYAGLSPAQVGAGLTVAGLLGLAASTPAGMLGDRVGYRRVLLWLNVVRALGFAAFVTVDSFVAFLVVVSTIAFAECAEPPNRRAYLSLVSTKQERVKANAYNRTVWNIGFALGSCCAGLILAIDTRQAYAALAIGNALSYAVAAVLLTRLPAGGAGDGGAAAPRTGGAAAPAREPGRRPRALRDLPFMAVAFSASGLYLHIQLLNIGLPLWLVTRTSAPSWSLAVLMLLNTAMVVALQVLASRGTETAAGSARLSRRAGWVLLGGCVLWGCSGGLPPALTVALLLAGMALVTLGEIFCSAAGWGLSYALAPERAQGEYLGAWSFAVQLLQALGPALFAALLLGGGLAGWVAIGLLFAIVGWTTAPLTRWAEGRVGRTSRPLSGLAAPAAEGG